jgi:DNA replication licensing factor MCM7
LQEYTILRVANQDAEDDENVLLEPGQNEHQSLVRVPCYPPILQKLVNRDFEGPCLVLEIPLNDLIAWDASRGKDLADKSMQNTLRYKALFSAVLDEHLKTLQPEPGHAVVRDTLDILQQQREEAQELQRNEQNVAGGGDNNNADGLLDNQGVANDAAENGRAANQNGNGATEDFPPLLQRRYELRILPIGRNGSLAPFDVQVHPNDNATFESESTSVDGVSLRTIRSKSMGKLVTLKGMVVRASDVKPYCQVATYSCDACGCEIYQVLEGKREFMPQRMCPSRECQNDRRTRLDTLHLQTRGSKFAKFQELKLQELPHQVPMGHVPRSMSVYCRGELTRLASPGDVVTIDGVFLPQRVAEGGYRAMKAGLVATLFLEAQNIIVHKKSYDESLLDSLSEKESARLDTEILEIATSEDPIGMLSSSIAPEIFGHEDIKRSLLLQLVGGVTRKLPDGMRIRGDINICLMGDPGVAKSQLLKHVASIAPRGVYTTGKGSSGVGLTAAITKDTSTGELSLEGGALVLADRGICAIDEFDK